MDAPLRESLLAGVSEPGVRELVLGTQDLGELEQALEERASELGLRLRRAAAADPGALPVADAVAFVYPGQGRRILIADGIVSSPEGPAALIFAARIAAAYHVLLAADDPRQRESSFPEIIRLYGGAMGGRGGDRYWRESRACYVVER